MKLLNDLEAHRLVQTGIVNRLSLELLWLVELEPGELYLRPQDGFRVFVLGLRDHDGRVALSVQYTGMEAGLQQLLRPAMLRRPQTIDAQLFDAICTKLHQQRDLFYPLLLEVVLLEER